MSIIHPDDSRPTHAHNRGGEASSQGGSMESEPDYYEILQVHPGAEWEVIEAAYRRLARKYHPDVNKDVEAEERMRDLNAAYEVLSNPIFREDYDQRRSYGGFVASEPISNSGFASTVPASQPWSLAATSRFWLRWLAVLPAGILSAVLVTFPVHWAVLIVTGTRQSGCQLVGGIVDFRTGGPDASPAESERSGDHTIPISASVAIGALLLGAGGLYAVRMQWG